MPLDAFGGRPKGLAGRLDQTQDGQRGVRQRSECLGQAGTLGVVTIFVPPAVLDEMQAVFHLPVAADVVLQFTRRDRIGIEATDEVSAFAGKNLTAGRAHLAIDTGGDLAAGYVQMLPDMFGVVKVDPKPARFLIEPLFSVTSCEGFAGVS